MELDTLQYELIYSEVKKFILDQNSPFSYYSLFSTISKKLNLCFKDSEFFTNLFQKNFIIKNIIFKLQFEFYKDFSFALIFENDLIFFSKINSNKSFFSLIKGEFIEDTDLIYEDKTNKENLPSINSLRNYYFDFENLKNIDEKSVEKAIDSSLKFASYPELFDQALKIFDLSLASLNIKSLNSAYRRIIKRYHPDVSSNFENDDKKMIFKIYDAYNLLKSILI